MKMKIIILSIIISSIFTAHLFAQKIDFSGFNNVFFGFEIGHSKSYDHYVNGGIWAQSGHNYLKISFSDARDNRSEEQQLLKGQDDESKITTPGLADIGLLYGKTYTVLKRHQVQFGTGISVVAKTIPDEDFNRTKQPYYLERFKEKVTVGIPAELRYSFQFTRGIGVNASWRGNANALKRYGNFSFGASMGLF